MDTRQLRRQLIRGKLLDTSVKIEVKRICHLHSDRLNKALDILILNERLQEGKVKSAPTNEVILNERY